MVTIKNTQRTVKINKKEIELVATKILNIIGYPDFDLGIWFTNNKTVRYYNHKYRNKDKPTDILSFSYHSNLKPGQKIIVHSEEDKNLGDLILSAPYIQAQANKLKISLQDHIVTLLVHGICHLLGYDHETNKEYRQMRAKESYILKKLKT
jgi:rRNA maturation RNase YbeY